MSRSLTQREKVLSALVGGAVLLIVNIFLFSYFSTQYTRLTLATRQRAQQLRSMQALAAASPLWAERDARLRGAQPHLENEKTAGVQLLDLVREIARKDGVSVEKPIIGEGEPRAAATAVNVEIKTKSTWKALISFLSHLQGPETFIVVENARLQVDATDPTQMSGEFTIAKWFAPK